MISSNRLAQISWILLVVLMGAASQCLAQTTGDGNVLNSTADATVAVRFFFQPAGSNFHVPLIFRVVEEKDPRWNTAPILDSGRTAYVTLAEMQQLLPAVAHLRLLWRQAETVEVLGSFRVLALADTMDITIVSSHGTARAAVDPKKVCESLAPLDSVIKTPRALWEFQLYRTAYDCKLPAGFNYDAYPRRDMVNR